jgi:glycine/D-amino acid oxidase-like deaminating enzyme
MFRANVQPRPRLTKREFEVHLSPWRCNIKSVEPHNNFENCYVATRFGTTGIMMSVGAGTIMADLIARGETPSRFRHILDYLSPARALSA